MDEKSKTQLIQQKIKQRMQIKKRLTSKEASSQLKRLTSNQQYEQQNGNEMKPQSAIRLRAQTSERNKAEQERSLTTDSSNKNDIDVTMLISDAFDRGFQLEKYLKRKNLNAIQCRNKLLNNGLFYTLILSKLARVEEDKYEHIIQKQIIQKLEKINIIEKQEKNCLLIEQKINALIDERLRSLSSY